MDNFLSSFMADPSNTVECEITSKGKVAIFHLYKELSLATQSAVQDSMLKVKIVNGKPQLQEDVKLSATKIPTLKAGIAGVQGILDPTLDHNDSSNRTPIVALSESELSGLKDDVAEKLLTAINEAMGVSADLTPFDNESKTPSEGSVDGPQS